MNRAILVGSFLMGLEGLSHRLVVGLEGSSDEKKWSVIGLVVLLVVVHSVLVVDAGPAIVESTFPTEVAELKSRRCLDGEGLRMRTLWALR